MLIMHIDGYTDLMKTANSFYASLYLASLMWQYDKNLYYRKLNKAKLPNFNSKLIEKYYDMMKAYLRNACSPITVSANTFKAIVELH